MACEIVGAGVYGPYFNAGAPVAGTNAVQTLTFGGTGLGGGTFKLGLDGIYTAPIAMALTPATLASNMTVQLDATFGAGQIVPTIGTYAGGGTGGTMLLTFSGSNTARLAVSTMTALNSLTGTAPTIAIATTTPGVTQTLRNVAPGAMMVDITNKKQYVNTGTPGAPTWTVTGSQT
jgi:hypothetical protein